MTAAAQDSKTVRPFLPALLHLSAVKVAVELYKEFDFLTLKDAFEIVLDETSVSALFYRCIPMPTEVRRAREKVLFLPGHLRKEVMEAVRGLHHVVSDWIKDHSDIDDFNDAKHFVRWRTDGTIDGFETAEKLIRDVSIGLRKRFDIACVYCFEDTIKALWPEIEASEEVEEFPRAGATRFWIHQMRSGSRVPWRQAAVEYFALNPLFLNYFNCLFFNSLPPKEREKIAVPLRMARHEDFRMCLIEMTKEEEEEILKQCSCKLLIAYLSWPLRILFLERAKKVMQFINEFDFCILLVAFSETRNEWETFDYYEQFMGLWNVTPIHIREYAKRNWYSRDVVASCFEKMKKLKIMKEDNQG